MNNLFYQHHNDVFAESVGPVARFNASNLGTPYAGPVMASEQLYVLDPRFAKYESGDLHLQPDSPCINAGDNAAVQAGDTDMDGQVRVQDGRVDIGAFEFVVPSTYTMAELISLLRVVAGLDSVNAENLPRLDVAKPAGV